MYKCVISSHTNPNLSGVARFNHILATNMGIQCIGISDIKNIDTGPILFSLKLRDTTGSERSLLSERLHYLVNKNIDYDLFFHTFDGLEIEYELIERCRMIYSGNSEIYHALEGIDKEVVSAWCPALITGEHVLHEASLNLFSFGMAHKLQIKYYKMLQELLSDYNIDYTLWVSTAFHEKANFGDFNSISNQLSRIFRHRIQFLGFLSDDGVNYFLDKTQLFIAFFEKGVRANNTSIFAAMNRGCAVLTNSDEYSPSWMKHGINILDIHMLQLEDLETEVLQRIGTQAKKDARKYASWDGLIKLICNQKR